MPRRAVVVVVVAAAVAVGIGVSAADEVVAASSDLVVDQVAYADQVEAVEEEWDMSFHLAAIEEDQYWLQSHHYQTAAVADAAVLLDPSPSLSEVQTTDSVEAGAVAVVQMLAPLAGAFVASSHLPPVACLDQTKRGWTGRRECRSCQVEREAEEKT